MRTALKILIEFVGVFTLTFVLSSEHIIIANVYSIQHLSLFFVLIYCFICWLCHRACGMHNMRFGVAVTTIVCGITFFAVESILHKDEKGCRNWILETIETASKDKIHEGCGTIAGKERSFIIAMRILQETNCDDVFRKIKLCDDVDALRIIAFAAYTAAWPMEAGPNVDFDNKMDGIFHVAAQRLFEIDSDEANESIVCCRRAFSPDGARSLFLTECEEKRRALRSERNCKATEPNAVIIYPPKRQP